MSLQGSHKRKKFLSEITVLYYDSFSREKEKLYNEERVSLYSEVTRIDQRKIRIPGSAIPMASVQNNITHHPK